MSVYQSMCHGYERDRITEKINEHIDHHFSTEDLDGKKVLLKVNLLSGRDPCKAVTTHPEFVASVVLSLKERGAKCVIADSPGGQFTRSNLEKAYRISGLEEVASSTGATLNYNLDRRVIEHVEGRMVKRIPVCDFAFGNDLIIALPKFKTHMLMGITCASKIMYGVIPGEEKVHFHTRFPHPTNFAGLLLDITNRIKPDLFIVDAIVGMEGEGPAQGSPRSIGIIASGMDNIEIDAHLCRVCGVNTGSVPLFSAISSLYKVDPFNNIDVKGECVDISLDPPLQMPNRTALIGDPPDILKRAIRGMSSGRPVIDRSSCDSCGICRDNCAGQAIDMKEGRVKIDMSRCIRCFCCHELCHKGAVTVKHPSKLSRFLIETVYRAYH